MKNLAYILLALLITSCKSPTAPDDEFEPYIVGNFKIVTPTEADYIGEQSNQKVIHASGDTVEIKQPGQRSLRLWQNPNDSLKEHSGSGLFFMEFVDSTLSLNTQEIYTVRYDNPKGGASHPLGASSGQELQWGSEYFKATLNMMYTCGASFNNNNPIIFMRVLTDSGSVVRVYAIHVDGIIQTVTDITKC